MQCSAQIKQNKVDYFPNIFLNQKSLLRLRPVMLTFQQFQSLQKKSNGISLT